MITSPLRRTALAAAAVAALSFPAAAQSDAAFASALGRPLPGLATTAQLKTQSQVPAGTKVPLLTAPDESFAIMFMTAMDLGKHAAPTPDSKYDNYDYTAAVEDPTGFTEMNISLFTTSLPGGRFRVERMLVSATTVSFDGDTKHIKNWTFLLDGNGRVHRARSDEETARRGGEPIIQPGAELDLADPAVKARFDAIIKFWTDRFDR